MGKERHPCRHPKAFPFAGGSYLWCPNCGALRRLYPKQEKIRGEVQTIWCYAWKGWVYPRGWNTAVERWTKFEDEHLDVH